ncbi:MAG: signal recognition particle-docking protein FtsY [Actinomycetota bacterium]|nr:signal recognition particle-docking protein FtsY [Actinomycetota bacterium]
MRKGWFGKLKGSLKKSRERLSSHLSPLLAHFPVLDEGFWEGLEEALIEADVGIQVTQELLDKLREEARAQKIRESAQLLPRLKEKLVDILTTEKQPLFSEGKLGIFLMLGVNGTGKTTTIAKIAHRAKIEGKNVLLAAADTYRAAAIEQLEIWGKRVGAATIKHRRGSDPAAVVYDAIHAAQARDVDVLLIDTAGRLHTYIHLMEELQKIKRVVMREAPEAEIKTLLVIDATTGQNGLSQARLFGKALEVDGVVLTKLDGTAKGGIIAAIEDELKIPVILIGVGEKLDDLQEFDARAFVEALLS